jgi:hypothetical protein
LVGETVVDPFVEDNQLEPIPAYVMASNFWLLSAEETSPLASQAWFRPEAHNHELVGKLRAWQQERRAELLRQEAEKSGTDDIDRPIRHYLLLPSYEWGVSDWYLEVIRPFIKKHRPTVGFSPQEAEQADRVTVVGNGQNYPEGVVNRLEDAGCLVEQIGGTGINIATELAER